MTHYQLRAEDPLRENPFAPSRHCWHVVRFGAAFALCSRRLNPVTSVRPIQDADHVPVDHRCTACWERAFQELMLPA